MPKANAGPAQPESKAAAMGMAGQAMGFAGAGPARPESKASAMSMMPPAMGGAGGPGAAMCAAVAATAAPKAPAQAGPPRTGVASMGTCGAAAGSAVMPKAPTQGAPPRPAAVAQPPGLASAGMCGAAAVAAAPKACAALAAGLHPETTSKAAGKPPPASPPPSAPPPAPNAASKAKAFNIPGMLSTAHGEPGHVQGAAARQGPPTGLVANTSISKSKSLAMTGFLSGGGLHFPPKAALAGGPGDGQAAISKSSAMLMAPPSKSASMSGPINKVSADAMANSKSAGPTMMGGASDFVGFGGKSKGCGKGSAESPMSAGPKAAFADGAAGGQEGEGGDGVGDVLPGFKVLKLGQPRGAGENGRGGRDSVGGGHYSPEDSGDSWRQQRGGQYNLQDSADSWRQHQQYGSAGQYQSKGYQAATGKASSWGGGGDGGYRDRDASHSGGGGGGGDYRDWDASQGSGGGRGGWSRYG